MHNPYLDGARLGRNDWWRYLLGVGFILFATFVVGALPALAVIGFLLVDDNPATGFDPNTGMPLGIPPLLTFLVLMFSFIAFFASLWLTLRFIHGRRLRTLVAPGRPVRWGRLAQGAAVWVVLVSVFSALEAALYPGRYVLAPNWGQWLVFAPAVLLLIPLQTTSEELFFRGYTLQGLGLLTRQPWVLALASGLFFALPHVFNPEVALNFGAVMAYYVAFGLGMALFTLWDAGLELALGVHAAHNVFTALAVNYVGSALPTPAAFLVTTLDAWFQLLGLLAALVVFGLVFFGPWRRK